MKIEYRFGNLFDYPGRHILQGCNAQGVMGSGVAKTVRALYPHAYNTYRAHYERYGLRLGEVVVADCGKHVILNGITQQFFGGDGGLYVDYQAIRTVIRNCNAIVQKDGQTELALPLIGAGLAGGEWQVIAQSIEEESAVKPVVYIHEQHVYDRILSQGA